MASDPRAKGQLEAPEDRDPDHSGWPAARIANKRGSFTSGRLALEDMLSELDTLRTSLVSVRKYQAALSAIFRPRTAAPGDVHRALVDLGVRILATTNYDSLLEAAQGPPLRTPFTWTESDKALGDIDEGRDVLFKIHGTADREDTVVMTQSEYEKASKDKSYPHGMSHLLQNYMFLFIGYGINDPLDLDLVFKRNVEAFGSATRGHCALMKDARQIDRDRWQRGFNVHVLPYQNHDDLPAILRQLRAEKP